MEINYIGKICIDVTDQYAAGKPVSEQSAQGEPLSESMALEKKY